MAGSNKIKGIYLAIELDTAEIKKQVNSLVTSLSAEFRALGKQLSVAPDLNTAVIERSFSNIATSAAYVKRELSALNDTKALSGIINDTTRLNKEFDELAKLIPIDQKELRKLFDTATQNNAAKGLATAFTSMTRAMNLSGKEAVDLAKQMGITGKALDMIREKVDRTNKSFLEQVRNLMTTGNAMAALQSGLATLGANISFAGMVELGKAAVDTTLRINTLTTAFNSIYKNGVKAEKELDFIRNVTNELGLEYYSTAEAAKGFFAAAQTTDLKKEAEEIFAAFSSASAALKLSQEDTNGVFLAVSQMMSKGKISAEELRQQLGERLPGAVQLLAKAMGKSTAELDKMMQKGEVGLENLLLLAREVQSQFGASASSAGDSLLGVMNRLRTAWTDFKAAFFDSDTIKSLFESMLTPVQFLTKNIGLLTVAVAAAATGVIGFFAFGTVSRIFQIASSAASLFSGTLVTVAKNISLVGAALQTGGVLAGLSKFIGLLTASPIGLAITGLTVLGSAFFALSSNTKSSVFELKNYAEELDKTAAIQDKFGISLDKTITKTQAARLVALEDAHKKYSETLKKESESIASVVEKESARLVNAAGFIGRNVNFKNHTDQVKSYTEEIRNLTKEYLSGNTSAETYTSALKKLSDSLVDTNGQTVKGLEGLRNFILSLIDAGSNLENTRSKADGLGNQVRELANSLNGVTEAAVNAGNAIRDAFNVDASSALAVVQKASVAFAFAGDLQKKQTELTKILKIDPNIGPTVYQKELLDMLPSVMKTAGGMKSVGEATDYALNRFKSLGIEVSEGTKLLAKYVALTSLTDAKNDAAKPKKGGSSKANKLEAAGLKLSSYKEELRQLQEQNQYATDSFAYAWSGTNKHIVDADKNIAKFVSKYKSVVSTAELQEAKYTLMSKAQEKVSAEQQKLLREWLSKSDNALDAYYERHGLINTRQLEDYKKSCQSQIDALNQMNATMLISEEAYLANKKNLEEKYKSGKMSSGEYASSMASLENARVTPLVSSEEAKTRIAAVNEELRLMEEREKGIKEGNPFGSLMQGARNAFLKIKEDSLDLTKIGENLTNTFADGFASAFTSIIDGTKTAKEAFTDMGNSMIKMLIQIYTKMLMVYMIQSAMSFFGGGAKAAGDGAVMGGNVLSAFSNGVYSTPTYFNMGGNSSVGMRKFANGGVFGEAGPEAIMPLTRMANGRLGVASTGSSSGDVQVNVYNYGNEKATAQTNTSSTGGKSIDIIIGDMVAKQMATPGTRLNRAMNAQTGTQSPVSRR